MSSTQMSFIVLIATCDRHELLACRALPSVAAQKRPPNAVIVIDDSASRHQQHNQKTLQTFTKQSGIPALWLANSRNKGASGTWNTGAMAVLAETHNTDTVYLAVLDDDDEWMPHYLAQAENLLRAQDWAVDVVASDFERRMTKRSSIVTAPSTLQGDDFLVGNPGVGGSTLIIRLTTFLRTGMFDESLPSCTDRDLFFRLSLLPELTYQRLSKVSVIHHAEERRVRLSNWRGSDKLAGLSHFANKYRGWMTAAMYQSFAVRAKTLFGWNPTTSHAPLRANLSVVDDRPKIPPTSSKERIALIIGVIVDPKKLNNPLFADILRLAKNRQITSVDVVVIPLSGLHRQRLRAAAEKWRNAGLRIYLISEVPAALRTMFEANTLHGTRPIAVNRSILQHAMSRLAQHYHDPVCWILDGDNRLHGLNINKRGSRVVQTRPDYIGEIIRLRAAGYDFAIGPINGAAPLPRAFTVRTQMLDLLHFMGRLRRNTAAHHRPQMTADECISDDYYHDCGLHAHLEQPVGFSPLPAKCSFEHFIDSLPCLLERLLSGSAVTRPLNSRPQKIPHRGGNTLVFNPAMLSECANGVPSGHMATMRRQDEIWRIVNESVFNRRAGYGNFPVTQWRTDEAAEAPDIDRIAEDIVGHAFIAALRSITHDRGFNKIQALISAALHSKTNFYAQLGDAATIRLTTLRASFFRISGIAASMRGMLENTNQYRHGHALTALSAIERRFSEDTINMIKKRVEQRLNQTKFTDALVAFPDFCDNFNRLQKIWAPWIYRERRANATALLSRTLTIKGTLRFLGQGWEGTVFTANGKTYKVLHRWDSRAGVKNKNFLPSLLGKMTPPILDIWRDGGDCVIVMPQEKTVPYHGGYGASLAALLASLTGHGCVVWDWHPKNMRRCGATVRLIDYGADICPYTDKDFDLSIRKAWLCWRWAWRSDLRQLLTASMRQSNLPELLGYQVMKSAVQQYAIRYRPFDTSLAVAQRGKYRHILDFGCGKGHDSQKLTKHGMRVDSYDPALTLSAAKMLKKAGVRVRHQLPENDSLYDLIICRHVICEIISDDELRCCLQDLRRLVKSTGKIIITACNPNGLVQNTSYAHNALPRTANGERKFCYQRHIRATAGIRPHIHRPEHMLLREYARAGFRVLSCRSFGDIDLDCFERCSDTLQWRLAPLSPLPPTTLIIRACAMDADSAKNQVQRLVRQLNFPRGFAEIILAVDNKTGNSLRPHNQGDLSQLMATAKQLRRDGWIDRIITPPSGKTSIKRLHKKWLNVNSQETHAANGAPLTIALVAFENCRTDFVLHVDIDMIVGRIEPHHDYLGMMLRAMMVRGAATMSLNIPGAMTSIKEQPDNPFRLEVRAGLTNIGKLKKMLPLGNLASAFTQGWHRATDLTIRQHTLPSLRGGDQRLFAFHPPNHRKDRADVPDIVVNAAEHGFYPTVQIGKNEWDGSISEWLPPGRTENFIFVICGRNVSIGKINRCLDSVVAQCRHDWGAIIIDDASDSHIASYLRQWESAHWQRITFFSRLRRVGGLENLAFAVRSLCTNPESVIVTLDLDDALLGKNVLSRLQKEYTNGADMTVGSMLHADKEVNYPACFDRPRANRGGNVWQHLRSFKKHLFDAIPDSALRDDDGGYFKLAQDWAYMLPIAEMARHPVWIKDPLYFYEPERKNKPAIKKEREATIARIIRRSPFTASKKGTS